MKTKLYVENMQCGHCVSTINSALIQINGIFGVEANIAAKEIEIDHTSDINLSQVKERLSSLGYPTQIDDFLGKAAEWDQNPVRVAQAEKFARRVMESVAISQDSVVMDFGCGTGLVGLQFAPYIKKLVMVDNSPSMLDVLKDKVKKLALNPDSIEITNEVSKASTEKVNLIVSLMAFHHLEKIEPVIEDFYDKLADEGYVAIADLEKEDGNFHNETVPHNGFDKQELCKKLSNAGLELKLCEVYNSIKKETSSGEKEFTQFLIIAKKI